MQKNRLDDTQKQLLVSYIENNPELLQINIHQQGYSRRSKPAWHKFAKYINSKGSAKKSGEKWKKTWLDFKTVLKSKRKQCRISGLLKTRDGSDPFRSTISQLDNRILTLIEIEENHQNNLDQKNDAANKITSASLINAPPQNTAKYYSNQNEINDNNWNNSILTAKVKSELTRNSEQNNYLKQQFLNEMYGENDNNYEKRMNYNEPSIDIDDDDDEDYNDVDDDNDNIDDNISDKYENNHWAEPDLNISVESNSSKINDEPSTKTLLNSMLEEMKNMSNVLYSIRGVLEIQTELLSNLTKT